jgi:16S rRNA (guanine527-N7)-methyltransferase
MNPKELLAQGIISLGMKAKSGLEDALWNYLALLEKWNKVYNLTAVREKREMVTHHLLDCLAVIPQLEYLNLQTPRVLDVGSGAGLPGIVLAIAKPDWHVTLLDSNHKKASFLKQAVIELNLKNAEAVTERVEQLKPAQKYDVIISRAFSDLAEFAELTIGLCKDDGRVVAMKGLYPYEELEQLPPEIKQEKIISFDVPGLNATRHLAILKK